MPPSSKGERIRSMQSIEQHCAEIERCNQFLRVRGGWAGRREMVEVWESDGTTEHRLIYLDRKAQGASA